MMAGLAPPRSRPDDSVLPAIREDHLPAVGLVQRAVGVLCALMCAMVLTAIAVGSLVKVDVTADGEGFLEHGRICAVRTQEAGLVTSIFVTSGDRVAKDEPLAQLDSLSLKPALDELQAQLEALRLRRQQDSSTAAIEEQRLEETLHRAEADLIRTRANLRQRMVDYGFSRNADSVLSTYQPGQHTGLDIVLAEAMAAEASVASTMAEKELLRSKSLSLERQMREMDRLLAQIASVRERIERLTIVAPADGVVLTENLWRKLGSYVRQGELFLELGEIGRWQAVLRFNERAVHDIRVGNSVKLVLPALTSVRPAPLTGTVISVGSEPLSNAAGSSTSGQYSVVADLDLEQEQSVDFGSLKRGYSIQAKVTIGSGFLLQLLRDYLFKSSR